MLSADQLQSRLALDHQVVTAMAGPLLDVAAYRSTADLEADRHRVVDPTEGHRATRYRVAFAIPTLVGPGQFRDITVIGFDLSVRGYPYVEPLTWVESDPVPFSPHFKRGAPVCLGEIWRQAEGRMLLGALCVHVARLLNWDEVARGGGYVGWNADAVAYHRAHYGDRPLDSGIRYPTLPAELTHGVRSAPGFTFGMPTSPSSPPRAPIGPTGGAGTADRFRLGARRETVSPTMVINPDGTVART